MGPKKFFRQQIPLNKKWLEYFHKLVPKNEMNEMGHLMNKNRAQAQRTA